VGHEGHDGPRRSQSLNLESMWKYLINSDRKNLAREKSTINCLRQLVVIDIEKSFSSFFHIRDRYLVIGIRLLED